MQPLRISCRPANAIVWYDRFMPLDSMIGHGWMLDHFGQDFYMLPTLTSVSTNIDLVEMNLPLIKRHEGADYWYWAASWRCFAFVASRLGGSLSFLEHDYE